MSTKHTVQVSMAMLAVVAASTLFLATSRDTRVGAEPDRTLVLSAKDYAFHIAGDSTGADNPSLRFTAGERVRLVVRNDEVEGADHNFKIPGMGVRCSLPIPPGGEEVIEFTVPKDGVYTYTCCSHPGMGGRLEIDRSAGASPAGAERDPRGARTP